MWFNRPIDDPGGPVANAQFVGLLKSVWDDIEEASIPESVRQVAYAELLRHELASLSRPPADGAAPSGATHTNAPVNGAGIEALAKRMGVSKDVTAEVFDVTGEQVDVIVPSGRLASAKSAATGQLAVLVAAGRQGLGLDDGWTGIQHVRDTCAAYNKYDQGNFSTYMRQSADWFNTRGKGPKTELRLNKVGWERAAELVNALAGRE
jgi:hypothetical protein